jgi:C4-type Zn-finger protein
MLEREKVVCKKCGSEMKAILTVPHKPGFVEQTLECVKCVRRERKIRDTRFAIKP